jgi:hypothetical protein
MDITSLTRDLLREIDMKILELEDNLLLLRGQREGIQRLYEALREQANNSKPTGT